MSKRRAGHNAGLFDELIVDNFAGGGGASLGIERAMGRAVDVAINHDAEAVALHQANHPHTAHYHSNVWEVDPVEATGGRPVGLAWFSPDCKHFSRAKGGKPVEKKIRGLAWVVVRWAAKVRPRVIMLENVREFETWGPLTADNRPCPIRKGSTFKRWVSTLENLGYAIEWKTLDAADFGAPTHRKRLFLVARRDGRPIVWPEPTHGPGRPKPYRTAAECIDWSLPCPSIFLSREEGRAIGVNRPLAEKTMKRIAMGLKRYVLDNPRPFIVRCDHGGDHFRGQSAEQPLSTVTQKHGYGVVAPFVTAQYGERAGQAPRSHPADAPIPTITPRDGGGFPLIAPTLEPADDRSVPATQPLGTITSVARPSLIAPHLVQYNGQKGGEVRGGPIDGPINVVTPEPRFALASAFIAKHYGGVVGHDPDRPLGTITGVDHHSIAAAWCDRDFGRSIGRPADAPQGTITAGGNGHGSLAAAVLVHQNHGDTPATSPDSPARTVTAQGNHISAVMAFLSAYYGSDRVPGQVPGSPLRTATGTDRHAVVTVDIGGVPYAIVDIGLRMFQPRELYRCQGFPDSYRINIPFRGKPLSKSSQVRMCGNSVAPQVAEALVRANVAASESWPTLAGGIEVPA